MSFLINLSNGKGEFRYVKPGIPILHHSIIPLCHRAIGKALLKIALDSLQLIEI